MAQRKTVIVAEDDPFIRLVQVVLDPSTSDERKAAFADFVAHDLPDFEGWCAQVRRQVPDIDPAEVRLVATEEELQQSLGGASALVVESLQVTAADLPESIRVVQKFGQVMRNIDKAACRARGVQVRTLRRRANIACAEQTLALMLALAKKLNRITGLVSYEQLRQAGYDPKPFDRRHTANSGWARIPGLRMLYESTLGIIGMGEIGRELALRAVPFGMRVLYYQRTRLTPDEEQRFDIEYLPLEGLLAGSDWVSLQLPRGAGAVMDRRRIAQMKPGACLVNTSQAEHVDREAVIEALTAGRLGGFALDPLYEEPGREDDELLQFENVILTPHTAAQPRFNALKDIEELIIGLSRALVVGEA